MTKVDDEKVTKIRLDVLALADALDEESNRDPLPIKTRAACWAAARTIRRLFEECERLLAPPAPEAPAVPPAAATPPKEKHRHFYDSAGECACGAISRAAKKAAAAALAGPTADVAGEAHRRVVAALAQGGGSS